MNIIRVIVLVGKGWSNTGAGTDADVHEATEAHVEKKTIRKKGDVSE